MNREVLARLTSPAAPLQRAPTGRPELTAADIAMGLSHVREPARAVILYLWAGQDDQRQPAITGLLVPLSTVAVEQRWPKPKPGTLTALLAASLEELRRPRTCRRCNGSAVYAGRPCEACVDGRVEWSGRSLAQRVGLPRSTWADWAPAYPVARQMVREVEAGGMRALSRAVGR